MGKMGSSLVCVVLFMLSCTMTVVLAGTGLSETLNRKLLISKYTGAIFTAGDDDVPAKYAVIFDAGSTGSRVHVFRFNASDLELLPVGPQYEFNKKGILIVAWTLDRQTTPGLSSYADNPEAAADSLRSLLQEAETLIPPQLQSDTPVRLGATAGLRLLSGDTAERILEAVRELFKTESTLEYKPEWVSVIDGFQEGSYMWVAVNYLLDNLGKPYSDSVAVVDLGGASVQMAYAISEENAANAPHSVGDDKYLVNWNLKGNQYYLYTHSYLKYGLEAARAQLLKLSGDGGNPCIINGYKGTYTYAGEVYNVSTPPSGNRIRKCLNLAKKLLNLDAPCPHKNCTFNGIWNGGGGDGQKNLYVATSFYYTAAGANIVDDSITSTIVRPREYRSAANVVCNTHIDDMSKDFPNAREQDLPFLCMSLLYEYTLLVNGFGIKPSRKITVVQNMEYKGSKFEAAWPLGCAVDLLSPPQLKLSLYRASS